MGFFSRMLARPIPLRYRRIKKAGSQGDAKVKKSLFAAGFLALFLAGPGLAQDIFAGRFVGYGYVYGPKGVGTRTEVRMDVSASPDGFFSIELNYLDDKVARFAKARRESDFLLVLKEKVRTDGPDAAVAEGRFSTRDGSVFAGTVRIKKEGAEPWAPPLQTMKILVRRLEEKPVSPDQSEGEKP